MMRLMLAGDALTDRVDQGNEMVIRPIPVPALQRDGLDFTEAERGFTGVDADRQIDSPSLSTACLVTHKIPVMATRTLAPGDDDAFGRIQMLVDILVPIGAAADVGVPPDGETFSLERSNQRRQAGAILRLVRDENVYP
jgi:hypothetical protein